MNTASLVRKYGKGKAWDRAGLYYLNPPMPQALKGGGHEHYEYVLVTVQGDTVSMYQSDVTGRLAGPYARWLPLSRDSGERRGLFMADDLSCTAALEAEGYAVVPFGAVTA